jgi:hypothetical protein
MVHFLISLISEFFLADLLDFMLPLIHIILNCYECLILWESHSMETKSESSRNLGEGK